MVPEMAESPEQSTNGGRAEKNAMSWAVLLGKWTEFVQSAIALPAEGDTGRWRESVVSVVGLQAVTFALGDSGGLTNEELALGLDRAGVLITGYARGLREVWGATAMPDQLLEMMGDARRALEAAGWFGLEWVVTTERFVMPGVRAEMVHMVAHGFAGDALCAPEGAVLFRGSPAVVVRPAVVVDALDMIEGIARVEGVRVIRQVYREVDEAGRAVRDVVASIPGAVAGGMPILQAMIEGGKLVDRAGYGARGEVEGVLEVVEWEGE